MTSVSEKRAGLSLELKIGIATLIFTVVGAIATVMQLVRQSEPSHSTTFDSLFRNVTLPLWSIGFWSLATGALIALVYWLLRRLRRASPSDAAPSNLKPVLVT